MLKHNLSKNKEVTIDETLMHMQPLVNVLSEMDKKYVIISNGQEPCVSILGSDNLDYFA